MKTVIIHGQSHKGSTYHLARMLADKIGGDTTEFFLPRDFSSFCVGCTNCFMKSEKLCPHYEALKPLTEATDQADVIILASPVYVYHATGSMKAFLDHYGYRWMVHRPEERMFFKQGVCISTAAGAGMRSTNKDMEHSLFFWGVPKIYKYGVRAAAVSWDAVPAKRKARMEKKIGQMATQIKKRDGKVSAGIKTKAFFEIMRRIQKNGWNEADVNYWKERGWQNKARPWKK